MRRSQNREFQKHNFANTGVGILLAIPFGMVCVVAVHRWFIDLVSSPVAMAIAFTVGMGIFLWVVSLLVKQKP